MDFWSILLASLISSATVSVVVSGVVSHFSNKKFEIHQRTMDRRRRLYTKIMEILSRFVSTVSEEESDKAREELLQCFREMQIWGSDDVVRKLRNLLELMTQGNEEQAQRNFCYKTFVIAMRRDILKETDLSEDEIDIHGIAVK